MRNRAVMLVVTMAAGLMSGFATSLLFPNVPTVVASGAGSLLAGIALSCFGYDWRKAPPVSR